MIRCILWGGYGWGNVGDELTLAVALRDMQKRFGASVAILSPVPGYTKALFPETNVIPYSPVAQQRIRDSFPIRVLERFTRHFSTPENQYDVIGQVKLKQSKHWADAVDQCELFYMVGGGYLTDLFNVESYLLPVKLARSRGIQIETAPLGIGPFRHSFNANKMRDALHDVRVRVRDTESKTICRELGVEAEHQKDDGFRIREVMEINDSLSNERGVLGINFYHQHGGTEPEKEAAWWRDVIMRLKARELPIEGFCFHNSPTSDFSQTAQLFVEAGLPANQVRHPDFDFRDACRRLMNFKAIVTARFHAAVVAGVIGIPTIAVSNGGYYSSKMKAACQGATKSCAVDFNNMPPAQLVRTIEQLISTEIHA